MSADAFFDTNVLLYLLSADAAKANRAEALLASGGVISVQVLNAFASAALRKEAVNFTELREILSRIRVACAVRALEIETHKLGLHVAERYGFSIYDSLIVAAAMQADCSVLFSEDLQHRQIVGKLTIRNPFVE